MATRGRVIPLGDRFDFESMGDVVKLGSAKPQLDVLKGRDAVWLWLSEQGLGGAEIASICALADCHKNYINKRLNQIRREANQRFRETDRAEAG